MPRRRSPTAWDTYQAAIAAPQPLSRSPALTTLQGVVTGHGLEMAGVTLAMANLAPDEGLSASFNSWFTLFGQFFDHGLDLVAKGQSGTVFIPLQPDDPLYVAGQPDELHGADAGDRGRRGQQREHHHALRRPEPDLHLASVAPGLPARVRDDRPTGRSRPARRSTAPTAACRPGAEVKEQAREMLGIDLTDFHVGNLPLLATDPYGNFIPGPGGFPQVVMLPRSGRRYQPRARRSCTRPRDVRRIGSDPGTTTGRRAPRGAHRPRLPRRHRPHRRAGRQDRGRRHRDRPWQRRIARRHDGNYDNELLDAHFITGDGRGNENIGLTAVHMVFHAEHNRLVEHTKASGARPRTTSTS